MGGRQTFRLLIIGKSGSGKSTLARQVIRAMEGRYRHLVIVNRKTEFAELAEGRFRVKEDGDPGPALRRYRRVHFHVTGYDPRPFLDALGQELMRMRDVLLVVDEAHQFFPRGQVPKGLFEVLTGGRENGHNVVFVTQMLKGAVGGIDPGVRRQASHLVAFRVTEPAEVASVAEMFPELGERVQHLRRPEGGLPPEYGVRDLDRDRSGLVLRDPRDPRRRVWVPL
ncbi:ATPase [Thermus phage P23-77]|uniref:ATPase n=1 Tax=Thermus virus P23-77 TaxID=1714272 RepID=C8CHL1_9VIRU|nr:terminase large subunit [Thermus phage P23-77]ACV05040.1 ATPase [Thermus phage P23-77]